MATRNKVADDAIKNVYLKTQSVWKTGEVVGMSGQSVHDRLKKIGVDTSRNVVTAEEIEKIRVFYEHGFECGDGTQKAFSKELGRTSASVCRIAREMGLTNTRRKSCAEYSAANGERVRKRIEEQGHPRGHLGKKHSAESRALISKNTSKSLLSMTKERRAEINERTIRTRNARGTLYVKRTASWKSGWRTIGGKSHFFRSRWEANYARYLESLKRSEKIVDWMHEPETFWFTGATEGPFSYLPDFLVIEHGGGIVYVEVKGWMDDRSIKTIRKMGEYYSRHTLIVIDSKAYRSLEKQCINQIEGWESDRGN